MRVVRLNLMLLLVACGLCGSVFCDVESERLEAYLALRRMMGKEMYSAAVVECKRLIQKYPDYKYLYETLPEVCLYAGDLGEAERFFSARVVGGYSIMYAYYGLGNSFLRRREFGAALDAFERAMECKLDIPEVYRGFVYAHEKVFGSDRTLQHFVGLCHRSPESQNGWYALALCHWGKLDYENALSTLNHALQQDSAEIKYLQLSWAANTMLKPSIESVSSAERILDRSLSLGDFDGAEFLRWTVSRTYEVLGLDESRAAALDRGLKSVTRYGQLRWRGHICLQIAINAHSVGHHNKALALSEEASLAFERSGDVAGYATTKMVKLEALMELGEHESAMQQAFLLLRRLDDLENKQEEVSALTTIASAFCELGAYDVALEYAIEAENRFRNLPKNPYQHFRLETVLGLAQSNLGNMKVALQHFLSALSTARRIDKQGRILAICEGNVGNGLYALGEVEKALYHYSRQSMFAERTSYPRERANVLINLARHHFANDRWGEARALFDSAMAIGKNAKQKGVVIRAKKGLADIALKTGDPERAVDLFCSLVADLQTMTSTRFIRMISRHSARYHSEISSNYVHALCATGRFEEAFEFIEQVRFELGNDFLTLSPNSVLERTDDSSLIEIRRFKQLLRASFEIVRERKVHGNNYPEIDFRLMGNVSELQLQYDALVKRIRSGNAELKTLLAPPQSFFHDLQRQSLAEREALLEFVVGEHQTDVFLATRDTLVYSPILEGRNELDRRLSSVSRILSDRSPDMGLENTSLIHFNVLNARALYEVLLGNLKRDLTNIDKLVIVPDGPLIRLPFELLVADLKNGRTLSQVEFLVRRFEISYVAAGSLLDPRFKQKVHPSGFLLAFGDPGNPSRGEETVSVTGFAFPVDEPQSISLPLPGARREVEAIAAMFGDRAEIFVGSDATVELFRRKAPNFRVIHLATHATYDTANPMLSGLQFYNAANASSEGILMAYEIPDIGLTAELVVLSACRTRGATGSGQTEGFIKGFNMAGVRSVISAQWAIADDLAPILMTRFYDHLLKGERKSKALQLAKIDMIDQGEIDPHRWGAFVLVGESDRLNPSGGTEAKNILPSIEATLVILFSLGGIVLAVIVRKLNLKSREQ
jgi:CHAT domain-containing protein